MEAEIRSIYELRNTKDWRRLPEARRDKERSSPRAFSKHGPADTLMSDFQPPELWENKLLLLLPSKFVVICFGSPRKLI